MSDLPIVVIGAGPQGLAAAAHLVQRDQDVIVLERGPAAGAAVTEWGHVRLFSAWPELIDTASRHLLERSGWTAPASGYPTGAQWVDTYLRPLAAALGERVRTGITVTGISRAGRDKVVDSGRKNAPLVVHTVDELGREDRYRARAVLDASGTWAHPNPAGANGLPALGEHATGDAISYRIPDDVSDLAGQHVVVVGSGHSATHAVLRLVDLARKTPGTRVTWLLRRASTTNVFGGGADELPERGALGTRAQRAVGQGHVHVVTGFRVDEIRHDQDGITITADDGRGIGGVARVFALTGFRPDTAMLAELRTSLDPAFEAVAGIASEIDPNIHSCGSVGATGARQLAQPEPGFFIIGAKSYGRAPTFLALTGYEQARSVAAHLAGDHEAAARNELVLPDTGVCGGAGDFGAAAGSCCAAPTQLVQLTPRLELQH
ncbi:FAD-dependent oxidoreductase [Microbacterium oryzae]|uniref:FAD-dependent oxidoreductase n=1 Tax=Microbacterium oryzae TaxID=743009 RepID=UPI0025B01C75|nr:FAD-dependent oxidoreductase [Microbacterium oryzae]MDN3309340.1 FAD-dependent oxidoreductase [Microbacterium oryzae]